MKHLDGEGNEMSSIKMIFVLIIATAFVIFTVFIAVPYMNNFSDEQNKCDLSPFNTYTNQSNGAYVSFWGNKCQIPITEFYETKKNCGTFGISCYESEDTHTEWYTYYVCFKYKTGESC